MLRRAAGGRGSPGGRLGVNGQQTARRWRGRGACLLRRPRRLIQLRRAGGRRETLPLASREPSTSVSLTLRVRAGNGHGVGHAVEDEAACETPMSVDMFSRTAARRVITGLQNDIVTFCHTHFATAHRRFTFCCLYRKMFIFRLLGLISCGQAGSAAKTHREIKCN